MRFTSTLIAAVGLLSAIPVAIATITITGPSSSIYWVQDSVNLITWDFTRGDPAIIAITVTNPNSSFLNGAFSIAENVDVSAKSIITTNITLNVHDGYVVNFVNNSNPAQVFAQSGAFSVKTPGTTQASQASPSGSSPSATATSPAGNGTGSGSSSGSATASSASSSSSSKPNASLRSFDGSLKTLAPMLGMSTLMSIIGAVATL